MRVEKKTKSKMTHRPKKLCVACRTDTLELEETSYIVAYKGHAKELFLRERFCKCCGIAWTYPDHMTYNKNLMIAFRKSVDESGIIYKTKFNFPEDHE